MNNRSVKHVVDEIERKQQEAAKLTDDLRKSVRLRSFFNLSMEGMVSLEAVYRRIDPAPEFIKRGYRPTVVECRVKIDGTVKRVVPLRNKADRDKLPDDVMEIIEDCIRPKR